MRIHRFTAINRAFHLHIQDIDRSYSCLISRQEDAIDLEVYVFDSRHFTFVARVGGDGDLKATIVQFGDFSDFTNGTAPQFVGIEANQVREMSRVGGREKRERKKGERKRGEGRKRKKEKKKDEGREKIEREVVTPTLNVII